MRVQGKSQALTATKSLFKLSVMKTNFSARQDGYWVINSFQSLKTGKGQTHLEPVMGTTGKHKTKGLYFSLSSGKHSVLLFSFLTFS